MKMGEWVSLFTRRFDQYLDELGETGELTARELFATDPSGTGNDDVTVTREYDGTENNRGFRIVASGHDVAFLEFGTGIMTYVERQTVQAEFEISPGSWSEEENGPFSRDGHWFYNGVYMAGTPPTGAMQEACNAMELRSSTIARRVFG